MTYFDYSNTGIYEEERNTKKTETKETNKRLKSMYKAFYNHMENMVNVETAESDFYAFGYNGVQLLTCFDSYLESKKKIMCFGKEAHTSTGRLIDKPSNYQSDEYYSYDFAIAHIGDEQSHIPPGDCPQTAYLKTRRIISGISEDGKDADEKKVLSILINNLNKTSVGGKYTPCFTEDDMPKRKSTQKEYEVNQSLLRDRIVYSPFEFEGVERNIYLHELNILRPTHLIFLSGTGYNNHIIRDLGINGRVFFEEKIRPLIEELSMDNPVSNSQSVLDKDEIKEWFNIDGYDTEMKIKYAYHPSAHLSQVARSAYNDALSKFASQTE